MTFIKTCSFQVYLILLHIFRMRSPINGSRSSLIIANAHAMTHDPTVYKDPKSFNPDRYLPVSEGCNNEPKSVGYFEFGRRYVSIPLTPPLLRYGIPVRCTAIWQTLNPKQSLPRPAFWHRKRLDSHCYYPRDTQYLESAGWRREEDHAGS